MNKKIVIWCGDAANQRALAHKISTKYTIAGIVIDEGVPKKNKRKLTDLPSVIIDRLRFKKIYGAWTNLMAYYNDRYPDWPAVPLLRVKGINSSEADQFTRDLQPDLVVVSGTALIKEPLLSVPATVGIINLHTGLSPFVKGGPNCTNWCIANNEWQLTGNTIMWLNAGIDAGNIITTETIDIKNAADLDEAHRMVMEHAHDLYIRAIGYLLNGTAPFVSVLQSGIGKGNLFLTKMWTSAKRQDLLRNWKKRKSYQPDQTPVKTVPLPEA